MPVVIASLHAIVPNILKLEKNMRVGDSERDQAFASWQRDLARGTLNNAADTVELPTEIVCEPNDLDSLILHAYPAIDVHHSAYYFEERCMLTPRNTEAHEINARVLDLFPGEMHELWANDEALDADHHLEDCNQYPPELLHTMTPSGFPLAHLRLKIGCPIMVLRNLQPREGVCNGSRGIVTRIDRRVLEARLFTGQTILIPRIRLNSADPDIPFQLSRLQFPIALSFAMTINKAQGQTFNTVAIDLRHPVFSHGQLYVALSRARFFDSIRCILEPDKKTNRTKNVIFREVVF